MGIVQDSSTILQVPPVVPVCPFWFGGLLLNTKEWEKGVSLLLRVSLRNLEHVPMLFWGFLIIIII